MKKSNHREKILALLDEMIQMVSDTKPFPMDDLVKKVHELFDHASLDVNPITDEKQNALKDLMQELHKLENSKDKIHLKNFIQALHRTKSAYREISS